METHPLKKPVNGWVIAPKHEKGKHMYDCDGTVYPSVTTVLSQLDKSGPLMGWAVKMTALKASELIARHVDLHGNVTLPFTRVQEILDDAKRDYRQAQQEAADVGTQVHKFIEEQLLGETSGKEVYDPRIENGLRSFKQWKESNKVQPVRVECYLASKEHKYAGMADFVGYIGGKLVVADWKTSSGVYPEMRYQLAAYAAAVEEMTGKVLDGAMIVRFDKRDGSFNPAKDWVTMSRDECKQRFEAFEHLVSYYHASQAIKN